MKRLRNADINPLQEKLATKAELLTTLNSLYCHHPSDEIHFESHQAKRRDLDYPIAVLLPVIIQLVFSQKNVEYIIQIPSPREQNSSQLVPYHALGGEYNDILQTNTCSMDNIIAIISSNITTIINSLKLIGTTPAETNFHKIFQMGADRDGLRAHWAPGGHQPWALLVSSLLLLSCVLLCVCVCVCVYIYTVHSA